MMCVRFRRLLQERFHQINLQCALTTSRPTHSRYDAKVFVEPVTDPQELKFGQFSPDDKRNYLYVKLPRSDQTPTFYRDHVVDKLVRVCLMRGDKETSQNNVYQALELVKQRQYRQHLKRKPGDPAVELNPFLIANKALRNCRPLMKLLNCTRGGVTYKVPFPIPESEAEFRAMKMMREVCRTKAKHGNMSFSQALADELLAAYRNEGQTIQAKQDLHKLCDANRAFAHYKR